MLQIYQNKGYLGRRGDDLKSKQKYLQKRVNQKFPKATEILPNLLFFISISNLSESTHLFSIKCFSCGTQMKFFIPILILSFHLILTPIILLNVSIKILNTRIIRFHYSEMHAMPRCVPIPYMKHNRIKFFIVWINVVRCSIFSCVMLLLKKRILSI